jgi:hypothetical protein
MVSLVKQVITLEEFQLVDKQTYFLTRNRESEDPIRDKNHIEILGRAAEGQIEGAGLLKKNQDEIYIIQRRPTTWILSERDPKRNWLVGKVLSRFAAGDPSRTEDPGREEPSEKEERYLGRWEIRGENRRSEKATIEMLGGESRRNRQIASPHFLLKTGGWLWS